MPERLRELRAGALPQLLPAHCRLSYRDVGVVAAKRREKLAKLIEIEGFEDEEALIAASVADSVCMAICMNEGCEYTAEMEPDQDRGWCEVCETNSMASALVLAGII